MLVSETGSVGKAEWKMASVLAFKENHWTEVSTAVILNIGVRCFAPEEHLATSGDIFDH